MTSVGFLCKFVNDCDNLYYVNISRVGRALSSKTKLYLLGNCCPSTTSTTTWPVLYGNWTCVSSSSHSILSWVQELHLVEMNLRKACLQKKLVLRAMVLSIGGVALISRLKLSKRKWWNGWSVFSSLSGACEHRDIYKYIWNSIEIA